MMSNQGNKTNKKDQRQKLDFSSITRYQFIWKPALLSSTSCDNNFSHKLQNFNTIEVHS